MLRVIATAGDGKLSLQLVDGENKLDATEIKLDPAAAANQVAAWVKTVRDENFELTIMSTDGSEKTVPGKRPRYFVGSNTWVANHIVLWPEAVFADCDL